MNIVVDTNIIFSALWNTNGKIAEALTRQSRLNFYAPSFLLIELTKHRDKFADKLMLPTESILELQHIVTQRISFIEENQISSTNWRKAYEMTLQFDTDDIAFVALALELKCPLWTGDKKIHANIEEIPVYNTSELGNFL